jgi:hypothetical protein
MMRLYRLCASLFVVITVVGPTFAGCASGAVSRRARADGHEVPPLYLSTRDQAGHELVKTEEFVVPAGATVTVKGLEFDSPACALTHGHELILSQVFNSIEEITENTLNDPDPLRVAAFKKMEFEIRVHATSPADDEAVSQRCAEIVRKYLTDTGTPPWRLKAKGIGYRKGGRQRANVDAVASLWVDFTRTR